MTFSNVPVHLPTRNSSFFISGESPAGACSCARARGIPRTSASVAPRNKVPNVLETIRVSPSERARRRRWWHSASAPLPGFPSVDDHAAAAEKGAVGQRVVVAGAELVVVDDAVVI